MGYFTAGYAFNAAPDWKRLDALSKRIALHGFKHKIEPLWILACNERGRKGGQWPFADFVARYSSSPDPLRDLIAKAVAAISSFHGEIAHDGIALGSDIHRALAVKTYFFAADDDGLDLACESEAVALRRFQLRNENGTVELKDGRVSIAPQTTILSPEEDGTEREFGPSDKAAIEALRRLPNVDVHETKRTREADVEPSRFFGVVVGLWPEGWPDPEKTAGLGTWDPLLRLHEDFEPCYAPRRAGLLNFWPFN